MTKRAAILFELPGSCDYWKDERLHEVVHDGTSHEFDGCRYGLKQRYAKKPRTLNLVACCLRNVMETMSMDLAPVVKPKKPSCTRL